MKKIVALVILCCFQWSFAQIGVIEIPDKSDDYKVSKDISLKSLDVKARIYGVVSTTTVTMVFKNSSNRVLEGRLTFPLPEGVTISDYALDINGKLRQAVPVPKEKAKEVFESIERRRIDPGMIEKVEGNNFRTRIYPIPANGERTVRISYNMTLKNTEKQTYYDFTFDHKKVIDKFSLALTVLDQPNSPKFIEKPDGSLDFVKQGNSWTSELHKTNFKSTGNLRINIDQSQQQQLISQRTEDHKYYFQLNVPVVEGRKAKVLPKNIGLIWDASLSMATKNISKELDLLDRYFKVNQNADVHVSTLNNVFSAPLKFKVIGGNWTELKSYLTRTKYDGGSDFSQLKNFKVDEYLFFTDGISSFGDVTIKFDKPVYTITSLAKSNFDVLKRLSIKSGGELINLNTNGVEEQVNTLLYTPLKFLGIKSNNCLEEVYPKLPTITNGMLTLTGIACKPTEQMTLLFGYGNIVSSEKVISLDLKNSVADHWDISKFWAQAKLNECAIENCNAKEMQGLAQQFGIVTDNTSLIVLENVEDYVKYNITPPDELLGAYNLMIKHNQNNVANDRRNIMERSEKMAEVLRKWWATDFSNGAKFPKPVKRDTMNRTRDIDQVVVTGQQQRRNSNASGYANQLQGRVAGVTISDAQGLRLKGMSNNSVPTINANIKVIDVKSTEAYMKHFEGLKTAESIYENYILNRDEYGGFPTYYFDVANLLFNLKDHKLGLKVLSSIADLDLENEELYKLLLYQLKKQNITDKEVWIAKKILDWRPMDPQSYRDYALALEDNGQYQEALNQLYRIFEVDYSSELARRDFQIEETVLLELNQLINTKKVDASKINKKLLADLPVNIRVVLNWNKDNTDIDLWVTDPKGEKCMYSNKTTASGGRLSQDFTGGFGPEQFILKNASRGTYKIETNFYGENQVSIAGPTALMAEIYLNYASGKQERKVVVFQSKKKGSGGNNNGILVAEFEY